MVWNLRLIYVSPKIFLPPLGKVVERSETDGGLRIYKNCGKSTACYPHPRTSCGTSPRGGRKIIEISAFNFFPLWGKYPA